MGTASYLSGSSPRITDAAEANETSCSPLLPPNRTPMRNRFFSGLTKNIFSEKYSRQKRRSSDCFQDVGTRPSGQVLPSAGLGARPSWFTFSIRNLERSFSNLEWEVYRRLRLLGQQSPDPGA